MIAITTDPIDHGAVTDQVRSDQAGAVCSFLGTVREMTGDRRTLPRSITRPIPRWPSRAMTRAGATRPAAAGRSSKLAIVHRVGRLELGEISVVGGRQHPASRPVSFEACRWLIDTLKEVGADLEEGSLGRRTRGVGPSRPGRRDRWASGRCFGRMRDDTTQDPRPTQRP